MPPFIARRLILSITNYTPFFKNGDDIAIAYFRVGEIILQAPTIKYKYLIRIY